MPDVKPCVCWLCVFALNVCVGHIFVIDGNGKHDRCFPDSHLMMIYYNKISYFNFILLKKDEVTGEIKIVALTLYI